jgi:hypothetical protein
MAWVIPWQQPIAGTILGLNLESRITTNHILLLNTVMNLKLMWARLAGMVAFGMYLILFKILFPLEH